jgi:hypothetical protein
LIRNFGEELKDQINLTPLLNHKLIFLPLNLPLNFLSLMLLSVPRRLAVFIQTLNVKGLTMMVIVPVSLQKILMAVTQGVALMCPLKKGLRLLLGSESLLRMVHLKRIGNNSLRLNTLSI